MKKYIDEEMIENCSDCPHCEQTNTKCEEGNGTVYYGEFVCTNKKYRKLGYQEWMYPGWEGTFTDEIPDWCPLEDYKEED